MSPKQWVLDPDSGGVKIKEYIKRRTEERIIRIGHNSGMNSDGEKMPLFSRL